MTGVRDSYSDSPSRVELYEGFVVGEEGRRWFVAYGYGIEDLLIIDDKDNYPDALVSAFCTAVADDVPLRDICTTDSDRWGLLAECRLVWGAEATRQLAEKLGVVIK